ncbi:LysR family transcriptional regulator [Enterococcus saccharolyticus]|uniref:HTH lysR-type domain-containing protein n=1 Tax=Enterococcus saccharolyticus subsp. saccharolyticus ATCC 43076 TaxID=1139996 RepID=S0NFD5_9ENTE|nr:LysR family transcriptional regulator [Enterococcus saccharolyticus]EOT30343.1 hypothetical protein OMQ_00046 [Enterococcus saccharolyticus subsp. saccharolyticus ATCC 43076]EOT79904.1 hypothetical protein I572_00428 [Enterococcus saccharolyticus subsp. saccharolyticus ATCC 43076]OJG89296.1 hypothetical protein RV16_GL002368 [Enterococcus saccharolyticus]
MNYFKLQVFCKLCERKKGAIVAKELDITPSTVSFHIQSLENELGLQLFYRKSGHFILTKQGEVVHRYAQRIIHLQEELMYFAQTSQQGTRGMFRLGVSGLANQIFLPEIIHQFSTAYPQIRLSVVSDTSPEIEKLIASFQLDYGILIGSPKKHPDLIYEKLGTDQLKLVFGTQHVFAQKATISKADILNQTILFHEKQSSSKSVLEQWLDYPIKELNGIELDSITSMKKVLEYGQTIAFISELLVQDELANNKLATRNLPEIGLTRTIYLVKNKAFFDDAINLNFKTLLGELMANPRLTQGANTSLKP